VTARGVESSSALPCQDHHRYPPKQSRPALCCFPVRIRIHFSPTQKRRCSLRKTTLLESDSVSGLVVKSIVAIDGPRVRFAADAFFDEIMSSLMLFGHTFWFGDEDGSVLGTKIRSVASFGRAWVGGFWDVGWVFWNQVGGWQGLSKLSTCGSGSASRCIFGDSLAVFVVGNEGLSMGGLLLCAVVLWLDSSGRMQKGCLVCCRSGHSFATISVTEASQCATLETRRPCLRRVGDVAGRMCRCLCLSENQGARNEAFCNNHHSREQ